MIPHNILEILRIVVCASCTDSTMLKNGVERIGDRLSYAMVEMVQKKLNLDTNLNK